MKEMFHSLFHAVESLFGGVYCTRCGIKYASQNAYDAHRSWCG